jgi:hypothetical protein
MTRPHLSSSKVSNSRSSFPPSGTPSPRQVNLLHAVSSLRHLSWYSQMLAQAGRLTIRDPDRPSRSSTVDRWVSGAGSQVDSSVLARSSLRLGLMSGLDGVGGWPWLLLRDGSRWTWGGNGVSRPRW